VCSDYYPELLEIYNKCRKVRERERLRRKRIIQQLAELAELAGP